MCFSATSTGTQTDFQKITRIIMGPPISSLDIDLIIQRGENLVPKDGKIMGFGKSKTSDPYVKIYLPNGTSVTTSTVTKNLHPVWDEQFTIHWSVVNNQVSTHLDLCIFDEDKLSKDDFMGAARVNLLDRSSTWYTVEKDGQGMHCHNASGRLQVHVQDVRMQPVRSLQRGVSLPLAHAKIAVGLSWDFVDKAIDLDASCVALGNQGQVLMDDTVYYGNLSNRNGSLVHSGDSRTGRKEGNDEEICMKLDEIPETVVALYVILSVYSPESAALRDVKSASVRVHDDVSGDTLAQYVPSRLEGDSSSMFLVRLSRGGSGWNMTPIEEGYPGRDFGTLLPQMQSYSRDIFPDIKVDYNARIAILQKSCMVNLRDYMPEGTMPEKLSLSFRWDIVSGSKMEPKACAVLLDKDLEYCDAVWAHGPTTKDGSTLHKEIGKDEDAFEGNEFITIDFSKLSEDVQYIGLVVNSFSDIMLDDLARVSCRLYDPDSGIEFSRYAIRDASEVNKHNALVLGVLHRRDGEWHKWIASEPANSATMRQNIRLIKSSIANMPSQTQEHVKVDETMLCSMPQTEATADLEVVDSIEVLKSLSL